MADLLLVDNDARLSELMAWFLAKRGHAVRTAVSYEEARARIAERRPELMLADLELGRERGREELQRMDGDGSLPRTLVVSGYLDRETELALSALRPVAGTLRKPFALDELESAIGIALQPTARDAVGEDDPGAVEASVAVHAAGRARAADGETAR